MKQQKMEFCFYKKIKIALILMLTIILQALRPAIVFGAKTVWPSSMNLYNDTVTLDNFIATNAVARNTKKGMLLTSDPREVFTLGCGNIAVNITLSGKGHALIQYLAGLKKRGVKITIILINDKPIVSTNQSSAPGEFKNPYSYILDFYGNDGEWQLLNFKRIVDEYAEYVDNWVIGNEINSQMYGFIGPMSCLEYTKVICRTFKDCYDLIKERNEDASVYLSFDQIWDMPMYDSNSVYFNKKIGQYRYNAKEQIIYVNNLLKDKCDYGIALHPYPTPIEESFFWDDEYAGLNYDAKFEKERPYILTPKNVEVAFDLLSGKDFIKDNGELRDIIISEFGVTSHNGEEIQAACLYYLWEKIRDNEMVKAFLYNAQTDLPDGYNFGLTSDKRKKRLAWAVFRDMDKDGIDDKWCKDLLDRILESYGYKDENGQILKLNDN